MHVVGKLKNGTISDYTAATWIEGYFFNFDTYSM